MFKHLSLDRAWAPGYSSGICKNPLVCVTTGVTDTFLQPCSRARVPGWVRAQSPRISSPSLLPPSSRSVFLACRTHPAAALTISLKYQAVCNTAAYLRTQQKKGSVECGSIRYKSFLCVVYIGNAGQMPCSRRGLGGCPGPFPRRRVQAGPPAPRGQLQRGCALGHVRVLPSRRLQPGRSAAGRKNRVRALHTLGK